MASSDGLACVPNQARERRVVREYEPSIFENDVRRGGLRGVFGQEKVSRKGTT